MILSGSLFLSSQGKTGKFVGPEQRHVNCCYFCYYGHYWPKLFAAERYLNTFICLTWYNFRACFLTLEEQVPFEAHIHLILQVHKCD